MNMIIMKFNVSAKFNQRRVVLGMSCAVLAKRAGLSLRTVQRVMSGEETDPGFGTVAALAECLGFSVAFNEEGAECVRRRQAEDKAKRLVSVVQGTSALEAQAVSDDEVRSLRERTTNELLAGSPRRLWAD
jgi:hypothetical protein